MDKKTYLSILKDELKKAGVTEIDEILNEYQIHFEIKLQEGYTEEEIANKLVHPKYIAQEYKEFTTLRETNDKFTKVIKGIGLGFIDILMFMVFILLIAWGIVIFTFSLSLIVLSLLLFMNLNIADLIPYIPYYGKLLLSLSTLLLGIPILIGSYYYFLIIKEWTKLYFKWHKNIINNVAYELSNLEIKINKKTKHLLTISFIASGCILLIAMIIMMIDTNSFEFWHEWNWFQ